MHDASGPRTWLRALRWIPLGIAVGLLAGLSSAAFLVVLEAATERRDTQPWLLWLLPVAGLGIGAAYHHLGGRSGEGNHLIVDEIHTPTGWVPRRMAPFVFVGTVLTHLFGGSAGREGTAIQMAGSLTDGLDRLLHLGQPDRRTMLMAAIAGGFGAVFGVPWAGCVFALEVQSSARHRIRAAVPALLASFVGDAVVRGLGVHHTPMPTVLLDEWSWALLGKVALAGAAMGLTGWTFVAVTHRAKAAYGRLFRWPPIRLAAGGCLIVLLTVGIDDRSYLGLSLPLLSDALAGGSEVATFAFAAKLAFTTITLGAGYPGGEVTPLFVIGATLGVTLAGPLGAPVVLLAAVGLVAVFAGAANAPLACTVMAMELFGPDAAVLFAVACVASHAFSSHRSVYGAPRPAPSDP